jgi:hypothetical protein
VNGQKKINFRIIYILTRALVIDMGRRKASPEPVSEQIFKGVMELGPRNLKNIARLAGVPYSKVFRNYKRSIEQLGISVRATVNTHALGLLNAFFTAKPTKPYRAVALDAFRSLPSLNNVACDSVDNMTLFGTLYVPAGERAYGYLSLFEELKRQGFISEYSTSIFCHRLRYSIRPEYIDWSTGKYRFEWDNLADRNPEELVIDLTSGVADNLDLYLIQAIEIDPVATFTKISKGLASKYNLKVSERTLEYHFGEHVVARKLLSRYSVFFPRKDALTVCHAARVSPANTSEYLRLVRRIPFLNMELLEEKSNAHVAWFELPFEQYASFSNHISTKISPLVDDLKGYHAPSGQRYAYTVPFELFDESVGGWVYDSTQHASLILSKAKQLAALKIEKKV